MARKKSGQRECRKCRKSCGKMLEICLIASGTRTRVPQQNGCHLHWQGVVVGVGDSGWWWCVLTISTDICPTPSAHPCPRGRIRWARCRWTAVSSACLFCGGWFACATRSGMGVGVGASRVVHIDWQRIKYTRRQQAAAGESEKENDEKRKIKKKLSQKPSWVSSGKFTAIIRQDIYIQI